MQTPKPVKAPYAPTTPVTTPLLGTTAQRNLFSAPPSQVAPANTDRKFLVGGSV